MFSKYLKTLSILKKFLFINFVIFTIIGLFTLIYLTNIEPSLLKKKSEDHINIINNTTDNIKRLNIKFQENDIRKFLFSTRFIFQNLDRVIFFDNKLELIGDTDTLDLDPRSFSKRLDTVELEILNEEKTKEIVEKKNIDLGNDNSVLVFMRGNRCHEISPKTLLSVCKKVNYHLGDLGQELNYFIVNYKCLSEPTLETIKSLYDLKPLKDKRHIAYRFFMNGWIEITKDGISDLKQYGEIPDGYFVWNSSIIPHEYLVYETKQSLEDKLHFIQTEQLHPITKEKISRNQVIDFFQEYRKKIENFTGIQPPTHYRDFIHNLSRNHKGAIDDDTLTRLKLAIGYLIHGYHIEGNRKAVVAVERFNIGMDLDSSNGGTGKSVLFKTLKGLVNYGRSNKRY